MGERKVLNKYYPPDFDPSKIPKKFNSRKETVTGEDYLGIKIFRFYIKCTRCSAELTIKTDPKNSDYQCEWGASRNFEPWRENRKNVEEQKGKREKEEMGDAMKALENRTHDSKVEMDILDALDEIRSLNARQSKMDPIEILLAKQREEEEEQQRLNAEDEKLVQELYGAEDGIFVKRISEPEDDEYDEDFGEDAMRSLLTEKVEGMDLFAAPAKKVKLESANGTPTEGPKPAVTPIIKVEPKVAAKVVPKVTPKVVPKIAVKAAPKDGAPKVVVVVAPKVVPKVEPKVEAKVQAAPGNKALSALAGYDDNDSDEN